MELRPIGFAPRSRVTYPVLGLATGQQCHVQRPRYAGAAEVTQSRRNMDECAFVSARTIHYYLQRGHKPECDLVLPPS